MGELLQTTENPSLARGQLAKTIAIFSIAGIIILGAIGIICGLQMDTPEKKFQSVQYIFGVLLPLIGTWMGTVLAFYFAKENFEAANKSVEKLVNHITTSEEKLKSTSVQDAMRKFVDISFNSSISAKEDKDILVKKDLLDFIQSNAKGERLPIFNSNKSLRYILHESLINDYFVQFLIKTPGGDLTKVTLEEFKNSDSEKIRNGIIKSAEFVSVKSNLYDVQQLMLNNKFCEDVFVTSSGNATGEVIGWITNNRLAEYVKV